MTTQALRTLGFGRFERRLWIGLLLAFVSMAVRLVWLGVWLEWPFHPSVEAQHFGELTPPGGEAALSTEVAR